MISRCCDPDDKDYSNYGGRGIRVSDEWMDVRNFMSDMVGGYKSGLQLDRIDNSKGYCRENCRWATSSENMRNTRCNVWVETRFGRTTIAELADITGIKYTTISQRYRRGVRGDSLADPVQVKYRKKNV